MAAKTSQYEFYRGAGRKPWRFRLRARNGRVTHPASQGYGSRSAVLRAIEDDRAATASAVVEEVSR